MSRLKFEVDFSQFWNSEDDEAMSRTIERIVRDECEAEVRKHIKALLVERRSETAKQVAKAMREQLDRLATKLSVSN